MTEPIVIDQAPAAISVRGPARGNYNLMNHSEQSDSYTVDVDNVRVNVTFSVDADDISGLSWEEKIEAIAKRAQWSFGGLEYNTKRDALLEWITREDPEDERLVAIQSAEMEHDAQKLFRTLNRVPLTVQNRVLELLREANGADGHSLNEMFPGTRRALDTLTIRTAVN